MHCDPTITVSRSSYDGPNLSQAGREQKVTRLIPHASPHRFRAIESNCGHGQTYELRANMRCNNCQSVAW